MSTNNCLAAINAALGSPNPCSDDLYQLLTQIIQEQLALGSQPVSTTATVPVNAIVTMGVGPLLATKSGTGINAVPLNDTTPITYSILASVTITQNANGETHFDVVINDSDLVDHLVTASTPATATTPYSVTYVLPLNTTALANLLPATGYGWKAIGSFSGYNNTDVGTYGDTLDGVTSYTDNVTIGTNTGRLIVLTSSVTTLSQAVITASTGGTVAVPYLVNGTGELLPITTSIAGGLNAAGKKKKSKARK